MPRSGRQRVCLVLASAALYAAVIGSTYGAALAWIALAPLLLAFAGATPARGFGLGLLWGLVATLATGWWLPAMLERYFGVATGSAWLALVGLGVVVDGLPYAAFGAWLAWCAPRRAAGPLAIGAAWGLAELARTHAPIANPFALLGYSQHGAVFAQVADLAGVYGVSSLLAAGNALLAAFFAPELAGGRPRRALALSALAVIAAFSYGELRLAQTFGSGPALRVALVQGALARERHWDRSTRDANLARYLELTRHAAAAAPELVFWPEFAVDFYLSEETLQRARLLDGVRAVGADVVLGGAEYAFEPDGTRYFNSVFLVDGNGHLHAERYDKQRLVPFAEYGPLGSWLRADTAVYAPGTRAQLLDARALRIGAFICGEALFPEVARALAQAGAELLANPSNDYWFGAPEVAAQQLQVAAFRAIENRRYLVRATSTGISAVIDPHGRVIARSHGNGAEIVTARLRRSSAHTLYQRLGDGGVAAAALLALLPCLLARTRESHALGGCP